jgi:hypothetical protein
MFSCSEHLAGIDPSQGCHALLFVRIFTVVGYELCTIVETMFSISIAYSAWGNSSDADRLESIAFNALPASFDPYYWYETT